MQRSCHQRQTCLHYGKMLCFHVERRYDQFCMYTHMLMNHVNGCHGDRAFFSKCKQVNLQGQSFFAFSHWGLNERFGSHEQLSWGWGRCKVGQISFRGIVIHTQIVPGLRN